MSDHLCTYCGGLGKDPDADANTGQRSVCPACKGTGQVAVRDEGEKTSPDKEISTAMMMRDRRHWTLETEAEVTPASLLRMPSTGYSGATRATNSLDIEAGRGARVKGLPWIFRVPGWWFSIYARPLEPIRRPRGLRIDSGGGAWGPLECGEPCTSDRGAATVCVRCPYGTQCMRCDRWVSDIERHSRWHARQDDRIVTDLVADAEADRVYGSRKATPSPDQCALEQLPPEEAWE